MSGKRKSTKKSGQIPAAGKPDEDEGHEKATRARQDRAKRRAGNVLAVVEQIRRGGTTSHAGIARELTARGVQTPTGKPHWFPNSVRQLLRHETAC